MDNFISSLKPRAFPDVGRDFGFGRREDGTNKGLGFFGLLPRPDGQVSSELSFDFDHNGKRILAPLIVPTLTHDELKHLLGGKKPTSAIFNKAADFALKRLLAGKNTFAHPGEQMDVLRTFIPELLRQPLQ